MSLHPVLPMLAATGESSLLESLSEDYTIEPKLDGIRCIVVCDTNGCRLFNRQLKDITHRFPEIAIAPAARNCILDGELVCIDEAVMQGSHATGFSAQIIKSRLQALATSNFQVMQRRANRDIDIAAQSKMYPARFMPFDVIHLNSANLADKDLFTRRRWLNQLELPYTVPWMHPNQVTHGLGEGIMVKDLLSTYKPGLRTSDWLKVKWDQEDYFYVVGVTLGNGKRADTFGALLVGSYDNAGYLKFRGEVGTGFDDAALAELYAACQRLKIEADTSIFTERIKANAAFFTRPLLQIKVRFQDYTAAGRLRFPRYAGEYSISDHVNVPE